MLRSTTRLEKVSLPKVNWKAHLHQLTAEVNPWSYHNIIEDFLRPSIQRFWAFEGLLDLKILGSESDGTIVIYWTWDNPHSYRTMKQSAFWQKMRSELETRIVNGEISLINEFDNTFEIIE